MEFRVDDEADELGVHEVGFFGRDVIHLNGSCFVQLCLTQLEGDFGRIWAVRSYNEQADDVQCTLLLCKRPGPPRFPRGATYMRSSTGVCPAVFLLQSTNKTSLTIENCGDGLVPAMSNTSLPIIQDDIGNHCVPVGESLTSTSGLAEQVACSLTGIPREFLQDMEADPKGDYSFDTEPQGEHAVVEVEYGEQTERDYNRVFVVGATF